MKKKKQTLSFSRFAASGDNIAVLDGQYAQSKINFCFLLQYFCFKRLTEHFETLIELCMQKFAIYGHSFNKFYK